MSKKAAKLEDLAIKPKTLSAAGASSGKTCVASQFRGSASKWILRKELM